MKRLYVRSLAALAAIFLLSAAALGIYSLLSNRSVSQDGEGVLFSVPRGASTSAITADLADKKLVRSPRFAYYAARLFGLPLKAGTYRLSPSMSTLAVLRYIADGKQEYTRVTVPEGLSLVKTAAHLENAGIVTAGDFLAAARDPAVLSAHGIPGRTAEGFLFPDTYFFSLGMDADELVGIMVDTFFSRIAVLENVPSDPATLFEKVVLASIIEREYRVAVEAPLIASVFANRIRIGMGLQSCATIEYIITEIQGKPHPGRLLVSDLSIPSDYNTYLWAGLPPGPISSPGLVALKAAFSPAETNYLYFRLTDADAGTHSFTRSLGEHVQAGRQLDLKKAAGN